MDKIAFPYRSSTHLPFLHVVAESGAWERHGLEVEYNKRISSGRAHDAVLQGDVEFVGGNHLSPYGHRARGDRWVFLGQTVNYVPGRKLVVRPDSGIEKIEDLRGKVVGSRGNHPRYNDWLQLKQHGLDVDRDDVGLVDQFQAVGGRNVRDAALDGGAARAIADANPDIEATAQPLWQLVRDKQIDAAFLQVPQCLFAAEAGLKVLEIDRMPMIYFTTISSSLKFAESHPDIVERFLKALIEGVHFFKTQPERSMQIIRDRYKLDGNLDLEMAERTHAEMAGALEPCLYPSPRAIENVYEEAVREDRDAAGINPMALWDLHYLRKIDDSGFVAELYQKRATSSSLR
jgi:ABC-type nitrate/sulfonate/bicarbonate transport system substrate-binding protein